MYTDGQRDGGIASLAMDFNYIYIRTFFNFGCHINQIMYMKVSGFRAYKDYYIITVVILL